MNNKRYDDALKRAEAILKVAQNQKEIYDSITTIFPELKESKGEKIRNEIRNFIWNYPNKLIERNRWLDWIEKQGEPIDKIEPKFHKGEWVVWQNKCYKVNYNGCGYELIDQNGLSTSLEYGTIDEDAHLWTIADAKEGDVLYSLDSKQPFIFKHRKPNEQAKVYCGINIYGKFFVGNTKDCIITTDKYIPATKEKRNTLIKAMTAAGYTFDFEKKELKGIEFQPFQWNISDFRTWQHIVCDVLTKYWGIGQYLDDGFCKKIAQDMQEEWNKKLCLNQDTTWSEEDEKILDAIVSSLNNEYFTRRLETLKGIGVLPVVDWLKSIKERMCTKSTTKTNRFKVL